MAFVLVPVAGVAIAIAGYFRWKGQQEEEEEEEEAQSQSQLHAPGNDDDDDVYWAAQTGYVAPPGQPNVRKQQDWGNGPASQYGMQAQNFPLPGPAYGIFNYTPQDAPVPLHSPSPPIGAADSEASVAALQAENQRLSRALMAERSRSAALSHLSSQQEFSLRKDVLELNVRLLDAEDARAAEREEADEERALAVAAAAAVPVPSATSERGGGPTAPDGSAAAASSAASLARQASLAFEIASSELALGDVIGEGAFGRVYRAKWRGSDVAVKKLFCDDAALGGDLLTEFRAEVSERVSL
jgi:hypothetical protein